MPLLENFAERSFMDNPKSSRFHHHPSLLAFGAARSEKNSVISQY
jgi:hypothetical protein